MLFSKVLPVAALLPSVFGQLNQLAVAKGLKYFGTATDNPNNDGTYASILGNSNNFGQITPANAQKWDTIEPNQGNFQYSKADSIVSYAQSHNQLLRCHNTVWYSQLPGWVSSIGNNASLVSAMKNHITNEVNHFKGKCYHWDVVNEAFEDNGAYRNSVFYRLIGAEFIPMAFVTAAAADPSAKLYYNDYNIETAGGKSTATVNIVKAMKARNIKIDGVGLQGHFVLGQTNQAAQTSILQTYAALGVEVAYTELDLRFQSLPASSSGLQQQASEYTGIVAACLSVQNCVGITIWDFTDKYSWIPGTFSGQGQACLWNSDYSTKPAYSSIINLLNSATSKPHGTSVSTAPPTSTTTKPTSTTTTTPTTTPTGTDVTTTPTTLVTTTSPTDVTTTTSQAPTTTTSEAPPPTTTANNGGGGGAQSQKWGQCGGNGWTGPTSCVSGTTCKYNNPYYSQCL